LGDVDLRIGQHSGGAANSDKKRKFHSSEIDDPRPFLHSTPAVCQGFRAAQWWRKVTAVVFVLTETQAARQGFTIHVRIENP
jgi:hypothetical protein